MLLNISRSRFTVFNSPWNIAHSKSSLLLSLPSSKIFYLSRILSSPLFFISTSSSANLHFHITRSIEHIAYSFRRLELSRFNWLKYFSIFVRVAASIPLICFLRTSTLNDFNRLTNFVHFFLQQIDAEIKKILTDSYERAKLILKNHAKEHKALAEALLKYETLDAEDIKAILTGDVPN